jgi:hypothetical protein
VSERLLLPLAFAQNLLLYLRGVYVHAQAPQNRPVTPGPYLAVIDSGASHSWVKPNIGDHLQRHSLEGYVIHRGDGVEEDADLDVKLGFGLGRNRCRGRDSLGRGFRKPPCSGRVAELRRKAAPR